MELTTEYGGQLHTQALQVSDEAGHTRASGRSLREPGEGARLYTPFMSSDSGSAAVPPHGPPSSSATMNAQVVTPLQSGFAFPPPSPDTRVAAPMYAGPPLPSQAPGRGGPRRPWFPRVRRRSEERPGRRITGIDAARGLAVVGMIFAHAGYTGIWGEELSALVGISHGHSSILFAVVAGLSLGMITGGARPPAGERLLHSRLRVLGRAVGLLLISGLVTILPSYVAVILASYALWFVWMIPALRWRPRTLIIVGLAHAVLGLIAGQLIQGVLSLGEIWTTQSPEDFVVSLVLTGVYPAIIWVGFVFIGMAMARSGITETRTLVRFGAAGLIAFILASAPFVIMERSLAPIFAASEKGVFGDDELVDWCLDTEAEELYPCTIRDYEEQAETFTPAEEELYWELWDEKMGEEYYEYCLDVDAGALYACSEEDYEDQELTAEQEELYWELLDDKFAEEITDYLNFSVFTMDPHSGSPFETVSSGGLAVFLIASLALLGRVRVLKILMQPLAVIGAMALTAYAVHIVVLAYVPHEDYESNSYAIYLSLGIMVGCALWRALFVAGPLENFVGALSDRFATVSGTNATAGPPLVGPPSR